ncbi:MAG: 50S ribosomal protein L3 [Clostridiales bacterium]|jgi:large subunit ribosomal protein L3|nr:50S ribosomal protein L3 [Clostridiales bacterium]MDR2749773.1 50S ribosomal protein L3 [Clostridiales bacterium]
MKKAILASKLGMTQVFGDNGELVPVTVLTAGPCVVIGKKTGETDGYSALRVGFAPLEKSKVRKMIKPDKGQYDKVKLAPMRYLKELKLENSDSFNVGDEIKADVFAKGERVDVCGISKGKGFQGAIKRYGQHRGPMSHGSKYHRGLGSMGSGTSPGRVKKGKHMPGHMGNKRVTVQNLQVVRADADKNILLVKGPVPGAKGAILLVKSTVKETKSTKAKK